MKGLRWVSRAALARVLALAGCGSNGTGPNDAAVAQPSPDTGATWTQRGFRQSWRSVASSADGTKLVAVVDGGYVYTSSNAGADWVQQGTPLNWRWVASSADGTNLVAVEYPGYIYTSSGATP